LRCLHAIRAGSASARNSRPCTSSVPARPSTTPGPTSQRGSANACSVSKGGNQFPALRFPSGDELLEDGCEAHALDLGVQREDVARNSGLARQFEEMRGDVGLGDAAATDELVQRGQRGGQLRAANQLAIPHRQMRMGAAAVGAVFESQTLREPQRVHVHLPAGGAVGEWRRTEDFDVAVAGALHLGARPRGVGAGHAILPADVVPGVDARLETRVAGRAHDIGRAPADVGSGQQGPVEQRPDAVMPDDRGAPHLPEEAGPEHAPYRASGMIGAERKQEGGVDAVLLQQDDEIGDALARAAQRVDVDLQRKEHRKPGNSGTGAARARDSGRRLCVTAITRRAAGPPPPARCRRRKCAPAPRPSPRAAASRGRRRCWRSWARGSARPGSPCRNTRPT
jgi:hypothetical protein